jgi:hypothetical protein
MWPTNGSFGDWNYNYSRDDGAGVDDWPPVTPCFDFASAMRTAAPPADQHKSKKVKYSRSTTQQYKENIFFKYFSSCTAKYTREFLRQTTEDKIPCVSKKCQVLQVSAIS